MYKSVGMIACGKDTKDAVSRDLRFYFFFKCRTVEHRALRKGEIGQPALLEGQTYGFASSLYIQKFS